MNQKATLTVTIEPQGSEMIINVDMCPKALPPGSLKTAANYLGNKVTQAIKEFYDDVKTLNSYKQDGWKVTDLESTSIIIRLVRQKDKFHVEIKAPNPKDLDHIDFKVFSTTLLQNIVKTVDKVYTKQKGGDQNRVFKAVTDGALKSQAWAQRN